MNYNLGTIARSGRDQEIHGGAAWFFYTVVGYRIIIPFCSSYVGFGCAVISKVHYFLSRSLRSILVACENYKKGKYPSLRKIRNKFLIS